MQIKDLDNSAHLILVHQGHVLSYDGMIDTVLAQTKQTITTHDENEALNLGDFDGKLYYAVKVTRANSDDGELLSLRKLEDQLPHEQYAFVERAVELHQWRFGVGEKCRCCMLRG